METYSILTLIIIKLKANKSKLKINGTVNWNRKLTAYTDLLTLYTLYTS